LSAREGGTRGGLCEIARFDSLPKRDLRKKKVLAKRRENTFLGTDGGAPKA